MSNYTGNLDTQDLGFTTNQYGMFPYPQLADGVHHAYGDGNVGTMGGKEALEAFFHTEKNNAQTSECVNTHGTKYQQSEGIFFDKKAYTARNDDGKVMSTAEGYAMVENQFAINANGEAYIAAIHKKGKFPFIVNLGNGHFTSFVLHKKPGTGTGTQWKVSVADSIFPKGEASTFVFEGQLLSDVPPSDDIYRDFITQLNESDIFKEFFGQIDNKTIEHADCLSQQNCNCLLNAYINCRSSTVDKNGNILFPGVGTHAMKSDAVNAEITKLRQLANKYSGYYKDTSNVWHGPGCVAPNNRGKDVDTQTKNEITKSWKQYENRKKFQRVLSKLAEHNTKEWGLTREQIKGIFNDAKNVSNGETLQQHGGYSLRGLPKNDSDGKQVQKRAFSAMFQKIAAEEGLFTLNQSSNANLTVGMRTKWVDTFAKNNDIDIQQDLQNAGFTK